LDTAKKASEYQFKDIDKYREIYNEFLNSEIQRRISLLSSVNNDPSAIKTVLEFSSYRENLISWMVDWAWTFDPRNTQIGGLPANIPWIPWPRQIEFLDWFYDRYQNREGGLIEKSRDAGATWLFCIAFMREWRWVEGFTGGIGSSKLENVDKKNNPKAIFEKLRHIYKTLPVWWLPVGFEPKFHDNNGLLVNPEIKSSISGEGGDNVGRSGRCSAYLVDESAFLEHPEMVDSALSQNTPSQFDLSTVHGMNYFAKKRKGGKVKVFVFDWKDDPRKGAEWYEHEKARLEPEVMAQEIDRDYLVAVEGIAILPKWVEAAAHIDLGEEGVRSAGLDIAAGGENFSVLSLKHGPRVTQKKWNISNGADLTHRAIDECNTDGTYYLNYDVIGCGHAVRSTIERTERVMNFKHFGVNAGSAASERIYKEFQDKKGNEIFINARAEWWYITAKLFENTWEHVNKIREHPVSEMISIEDDQELKDQLSGPLKMTTETGKKKLESKDSMRARGLASPDKADSLVLSAVEQDAGAKHTLPGYNPILGPESNYRDFKIEWGKAELTPCLHYGAISQTADATVYILCAIWDQMDNCLYVYLDLTLSNPVPSRIVPHLITEMHLSSCKFERFVANAQIMAEERKALCRAFNDEFRNNCQSQVVKLRAAEDYDLYGCASIANELILKRKLLVAKCCEETNRQLTNWRISDGVLKAIGQMENILMIISDLRKKTQIANLVQPVQQGGYKWDKTRGVLNTR
jgi:hypothetical protein